MYVKVERIEYDFSTSPSHHFCLISIAVYDFTTTLPLKDSNPICTLTPTIRTRVSFLTAHALVRPKKNSPLKLHDVINDYNNEYS